MDFKYRRQGYRSLHDLKDQVWDAEDIDQLAEAAAEDYWDNHDGFEARWPLTIEILTAGGDLIGSREVAMEMQPTFSASGT